jgi:hypothetical protein
MFLLFPFPITSIPMADAFFKQLDLGPFSARIGGGQGWSQLDLSFWTNRNAGMAARETAVRLGFKSDHLLALTGKKNPNDSYVTPEGETVYGRISITPGGAVHVLSAAQVYAEQVRRNAISGAIDAAGSISV